MSDELTFRPFAMLSRAELCNEMRYWQNIVNDHSAPSATRAVAERHAMRCREFLDTPP